MEPHASKDLIANLFSHDHNAVTDHVNGLTMLCDFYTDLHSGYEGLGLTEDEARATGVANADLALKYVSIKAHEPPSNLVSKCLDVVDAVLTFMRSVEYQLTEPEALCFIPTLVYKVRKYSLRSKRSVLIIYSSATLASLFGCAYSKSFKHSRRCTHIAEFSNLYLTTA
jgi:hypothetical protein